MKPTLALVTGLLLVAAAALTSNASNITTFGTGANQFTIDFVPITNPGGVANPADTTGNPNPAGAVSYDYVIGKYEISEDMIAKANAEGGLGITKTARGPDKPATEVSWFEAAKFVNWLNTSQGFQAAYKFDAMGDFQLWSSAEAWQMDGENLYRHKDAQYFLPSVDEWYKAAYYDPTSGSYFDYPTGSNTAPMAVASGTAAGTAVYNQSLSTGPADINLAGGLSPYGTMGQGGNVYEWDETAKDLINDSSVENRGRRGGSWPLPEDNLQSSLRFDNDPQSEFFDFGFRVAGASRVPEGGAGPLAAFVLLGLCVVKRRRTVTASL